MRYSGVEVPDHLVAGIVMNRGESYPAADEPGKHDALTRLVARTLRELVEVIAEANE